MESVTPPTVTRFFKPHPCLSDEVNAAIVQSEIEGGVLLSEVSAGTVLNIQTKHRWYRMMYHGEGKAEISGHPKYCPELVEVTIHGSTWGGPMLKVGYVGRGMHLEFRHPDYANPIVTSRIVDVWEVCKGGP